jgi:hypothetical protein
MSVPCCGRHPKHLSFDDTGVVSQLNASFPEGVSISGPLLRDVLALLVEGMNRAAHAVVDFGVRATSKEVTLTSKEVTDAARELRRDAVARGRVFP